ncbi:MAG: roadblock/LC7 domain-containing protein [Methanosarcinales archaeon]|nr:roadblock/LC7 domain-containing protein [Methanosarcinales archaeon]
MNNTKLEEVMSCLVSTVAIDFAVITSRDGLPILSKLNTKGNINVFCAMAATMFGASETTITELNGDIAKRVTIESDSSKIIALGAGPNALLAVQITSDAGLGLVLAEMDVAVQKIKELI